jgi:hypothetical protein
MGLLSAMMLCGCGSSNPPISVTTALPTAQTDQGFTVTVSATLTNDSSNKGVSWSLNGPGSLSNQTPTGVTYNAPAPSNNSTVVTATVTATSVADDSKTSASQITVNPLPQIPFQSLLSGTMGSNYNQTISEAGGTSPFKWSLNLGAVPNGLTLNSGTGAISGTPSGGGTWYFSAELIDAAGATAFQGFLSLTINSNAPPRNPVPFLNQPLAPSSAAPGGPAFTLTVSGTGFVSGATVNFNGTALPTTFVNRSQVTAAVPAAAIAKAGTAAITVANPAPAGALSNAIYFPVASPEATVNFSNAPGSPITFNLAGVFSLAAGDFSGSGRIDLAAGFGNQLALFLGNGDGTFGQGTGSPIRIAKPPFNTLATPIISAIAVGDFNNSGNLGQAVLDRENANVNIFLGNGNGSFNPSTTSVYTGGGFSASEVVADWNGDGNLDLAVANISGSALSILLGYGDGAFNLVQPAPIFFASANYLAAGDFNGDGRLDIVVVPAFAPNITFTIFLGNGDGTFTQVAGAAPTVGTNPSAIAVGDFNGDGKLDLAAANSADNTVTILLGNGDGTFAPAPGSPISVGTTPYALAVGDFTGSGNLGLAIANIGSNNVTILLGNGDGTFTQAAGSPVAVGKAPAAIVTADFNGSGRLGFAVANASDSTISILVQQ